MTNPSDADRATTGRSTRRLIEAMPKAELHLHLDGSLRVETALELARTRGVDAPTRRGPAMSSRSIAPMPCADQAELLRAFDLPIALMQDAEALERITAELVETKAADSVRYVEIRWGPLLHVARGLSLADGIAAVCCGAAAAAARTGITVRLICTALRSHDPAANVGPRRDRGPLPRPGPDRLGPRRPGGGLPGPARSTPRPSRRPEPAACGSPLHAGEWGGAAQVRRALDVGPGADRPRPGRHRRPGALCRADGPRRDPRPLPDLERAGRHRAEHRPRTRWRGSTGRACPSRSTRTTRPSRTSPCPRSTPNAVERIGLTLPSSGRSTGVRSTSPSPMRRPRAAPAAFDAWAAAIPELGA